MRKSIRKLLVLLASIWAVGGTAAASPARRAPLSRPAAAKPPRVTVFWYIKSAWRAKTENLVKQVEEGLLMDERIRFVPFQEILLPPAEAKRLLQQAKKMSSETDKALFELDLDKALASAKKAAILYRDALWYLLETPQGPAPLITALGQLAAVAHQVGDTELRNKALSLILALQPKWNPPQDAPSELRDAVMSLRLERDELGTAPLRVTTKPPAAVVYLDGQRVGRTPLELKTVSVGYHFVTLTRRGYRPVTKSVKVEPQQGGAVDVTLELISEPLWDKLKLARAEMGKAVAGPGIQGAAKLLGVDVLCLARVVLNGSEASLTVACYDRRTRRVLGRPIVRKIDLGDVTVDVGTMMTELLAQMVPKPKPSKPRKVKRRKGPSRLLIGWRKFRKWKGFWYVWGGVGGLVLTGVVVGLAVGLTARRPVRPGGIRHILFLRPGNRPSAIAGRFPLGLHWHWR